jgi:hypothetical protein
MSIQFFVINDIIEDYKPSKALMMEEKYKHLLAGKIHDIDEILIFKIF